MDNLKYKEFYTRNLPHFQPEGAIFSVTFRLAFSLPHTIKEKLKQEKKEFDRVSSSLTGSELHVYISDFERKYFEEFDDFLDKYSKSPTWLSIEIVSKEVAASIHFLENRLYDLHAYCIMPNHVHMIFRPLKYQNEEFHSLSRIMYSLKRYTASSCNKLLRRKGHFWHHENYDHFIRDDKDLAFQINYLFHNPVKARLVDEAQKWKYTWTKDSYDLNFE